MSNQTRKVREWISEVSVMLFIAWTCSFQNIKRNSSDPQCKDDNERFTLVPLNPLSDQ